MRHYDGERRPGLTRDGTQHNHFRGVKKLLERAVQTVLNENAAQAATRAAHKVIVRGLTRLNPRIPVLSRAGDLAPYGVRREWNHLWLVNPLDGESAFSTGSAEFSVNIALIEDGRPICGAVYAPAMDTVYYGVVGKGAYRRAHDGEPVRLAPSHDPMQPSNADAGTRGAAAATEQGGGGSSRALAMCILSGGSAKIESTFQPSMEWQTAAAHAILNCAGMRVCESESGRELRYNKEDPAISFVKVESGVAAHA